jgi:2-keto-3-deoxy-L-rhamnonate aldolase RhmA
MVHYDPTGKRGSTAHFRAEHFDIHSEASAMASATSKAKNI